MLDWIRDNWIQVGVALWTLEKALELITTITPWKWDDNVGVILGKWLSKLWKKP